MYMYHVMNLLVDIWQHIVLDINPKRYQPRYFLTSCDGPIVLLRYREVSASFWIGRIRLGDGRDPSPVLISHMRLLWQYSLHLSTIEPSPIQGTSSDGTHARGFLWESARKSSAKQAQGITLWNALFLQYIEPQELTSLYVNMLNILLLLLIILHLWHRFEDWFIAAISYNPHNEMGMPGHKQK